MKKFDKPCWVNEKTIFLPIARIISKVKKNIHARHFDKKKSWKEIDNSNLNPNSITPHHPPNNFSNDLPLEYESAFHSIQNSGNYGWYIKWNGPFRSVQTGMFGTSHEGGPLWPVWSFRLIGPKCPFPFDKNDGLRHIPIAHENSPKSAQNIAKKRSNSARIFEKRAWNLEIVLESCW